MIRASLSRHYLASFLHHHHHHSSRESTLILAWLETRIRWLMNFLGNRKLFKCLQPLFLPKYLTSYLFTYWLTFSGTHKHCSKSLGNWISVYFLWLSLLIGSHLFTWFKKSSGESKFLELCAQCIYWKLYVT